MDSIFSATSLLDTFLEPYPVEWLQNNIWLMLMVISQKFVHTDFSSQFKYMLSQMIQQSRKYVNGFVL